MRMTRDLAARLGSEAEIKTAVLVAILGNSGSLSQIMFP